MVDDDQTKISKWNKINEVSTLLPSATAEKYDENLNNNFKQFNNNLQSYFTNFTQAVGKIKFVDKKPQQLTIDLPIDYYGQAETIGITQYVTTQAEKYFDNIDSYEIRIKDGNNARALITKLKMIKNHKFIFMIINDNSHRKKFLFLWLLFYLQVFIFLLRLI